MADEEPTVEPQKTESPPEGPPVLEDAPVIPIKDGWDNGYWGVTYAAGDYSVAGVTGGTP